VFSSTNIKGEPLGSPSHSFLNVNLVTTGRT
jgi:hypothetical protein